MRNICKAFQSPNATASIALFMRTKILYSAICRTQAFNEALAVGWRRSYMIRFYKRRRRYSLIRRRNWKLLVCWFLWPKNHIQNHLLHGAWTKFNFVFWFVEKAWWGYAISTIQRWAIKVLEKFHSPYCTQWPLGAPVKFWKHWNHSKILQLHREWILKYRYER